MDSRQKFRGRLVAFAAIGYQRPVQQLAYYITAHGYGHGVRSCDILAAFRRLRPQVGVVVVTDLPVDFLAARIGNEASARPVVFRRGSFDSGMYQVDSIRVDLARSLADAEVVQARRAVALREEVDFMRREKIGVVVADIPALPFEAARVAGVPSFAVGNFGWDWIYEDLTARDPRWASIAAAFREGYEQADLLIRLPFSEPMAAFRRRIDIPLVSTAGHVRRDELAKITGASPDKPWVLVSFSTLVWNDEALARVEALAGYEFFTALPLAWPGRRNLHAVDRHVMPFVDLVASADLVVSKPGYGILSECAVADKPLVYVEREDFREYPVLEAALRRHLRHVHLPAAKLYAGDLAAALAQGLVAPPPVEKVGCGGAEIAAQRMAAAL